MRHALRHLRRLAGLLFLGFSSVAAASTADHVPTLNDLRAASGFERFAASGACIKLQGEGQMNGADVGYRQVFRPGGAFRESVSGPLASLVVSDGTRVWQKDAQGAPFVVDLFMREVLLLTA